MTKFIKTIQLTIITSALLTGAAMANTTSDVQSTDVVRSNAHVVNVDKEAVNTVAHNQALVELEATGDVDKYIENNEKTDKAAKTIPTCDNLAVPTAVKDSIRCQ